MFKPILNSKLPKHTLRESGAGFTLVELLVVIAIIGILSSVAVVSLNSVRVKAKDTAALNALTAIQPGIFLCMDNDVALKCLSEFIPGGGDNCGEDADRPDDSGGFPICLGSDVNWPDLVQYNWNYSDPVTYTLNNNIWSFKAARTGSPGVEITCTQTGCTTIGF